MRLNRKRIEKYVYATVLGGSGARLVKSGEEVPTVPIFDWEWVQTGGALALQAAHSFWKASGGVIVFYGRQKAAAVKGWTEGLRNKYKSIGGRASCALCGILRGGGMAFAPTSLTLHKKPILEEMFRFVAENMDSRWLPAVVLPTFDAPLLTKARDKQFKGSKLHLDRKGGDWIGSGRGLAPCQVKFWVATSSCSRRRARNQQQNCFHLSKRTLRSSLWLLSQ